MPVTLSLTSFLYHNECSIAVPVPVSASVPVSEAKETQQPSLGWHIARVCYLRKP